MFKPGDKVLVGLLLNTCSCEVWYPTEMRVYIGMVLTIKDQHIEKREWYNVQEASARWTFCEHVLTRVGSDKTWEIK